MALYYCATWLAYKTRATFSSNQNWSKTKANCGALAHVFPALRLSIKLLRFLIGWLGYLYLLWLARSTTLVLVLEHSFGNHSIKTFSILTGSPHSCHDRDCMNTKTNPIKIIPGIERCFQIGIRSRHKTKQFLSKEKKQFVCNYLVIIKMKITTGQLDRSSDQQLKQKAAN